MKLVWFILLLQFNLYQFDPLWQSMYQTYPAPSEQEPKTYDYKESDTYQENYSSDAEAEIYHWELGTPDNIPETEVIY